MSARVDKIKKDKFKKKLDDAGKLSPTQSEGDEKITFKVLDGEDIQSLAIKEENVKKAVASEKARLKEKEDDVLVKKANKQFYPTVSVKVAKLVPEKPLKPIDTSDNLGIRFDKYGNCVPYSILGGVEDFLQEAVSHGNSINLPYDTLDSDRPAANLYLRPNKKSELKYKHLSGDNGHNALQNWTDKMLERKRIQEAMSKAAKCSVDDLVMNQGDKHLQYNKTKTLIDRTLPFLEDGKGYRLGSEYWYQPILLGTEEKGLHTTLTKSEKGVLPPIEHIGKPPITLKETDFSDKQPTVKRYPWDESKYLNYRMQTIESLVGELVPHLPQFDELQVVGENPFKKPASELDNKAAGNAFSDPSNSTWVNPNIKNSEAVPSQWGQNPYFMPVNEEGENEESARGDVLAEHPDVIEQPVFGPAVLFGGQMATWTGSECENEGVVAMESRLNFETKAGKRVLATFEIHNVGTTSIYYDWKKIPEPNHFDIINPKVQRFYFDTRSGVILPGDVHKVHVVFKSKRGGIYSEKWEFTTHPQLLSAASLILTLRGIAIQEDKFKKTRVQIERKLFSQEAEMIARGMVDVILSGVRTPPRPQTPQNSYLTEEDIFSSKNPQFCYDNDSVQALKKLFQEMFEESDRPNHAWNLSIDDLKQLIMEMDEADPNKQNMLLNLNSILENMSFSLYVPNESKMYSVCYSLLCEGVDEIVDEMNSIKVNLNLPITLYEEILPAPDEFNDRYEEWKKEFEIFKAQEAERKARAEKDSKGKKTDKKKDDKKKDDKKKSPVQSGKKSKAGLGADPLASSRSASRNQLDKTPDRSRSPTALTEAQIKLKSVFMEKAYSNVYHMLCKLLDNIESQFVEIEKTSAADDINKKLEDFVMLPKMPMPLHCDYID